MCRHIGRKHAHTNVSCHDTQTRHAMLELKQERVQEKASRYLSTLADWRDCEIFRTCDYVLWIERPCRTTEKITRHKNMTETRVAGQRDNVSGTLLAPHVSNLVWCTSARVTGPSLTTTLPLQGSAVPEHKTQTARHHSREMLFLSDNRCE